MDSAEGERERDGFGRERDDGCFTFSLLSLCFLTLSEEREGVESVDVSEGEEDVDDEADDVSIESWESGRESSLLR